MFLLRYKEYIFTNILEEWSVSSDKGLVKISPSLNQTWYDLKDENSCLLYCIVI